MEFCRHYKTSPQTSLQKRFIIFFYSFVQVFIFIPVNIFPHKLLIGKCNSFSPSSSFLMKIFPKQRRLCRCESP